MTTVTGYTENENSTTLHYFSWMKSGGRGQAKVSAWR